MEKVSELKDHEIMPTLFSRQMRGEMIETF